MFATLSSRASRRPSRDFTSSSRRRAVTARRVQARALHAEGATAHVRRPLLHGIGAEKAPAKAPGLNEDRIVSPELGVQEAREDDFLVPRLEGDYGVREQKNLFAITRDGLRLIPELTPFPTERGCVTHTNLAGAAVVGGELWARPGAPYIWTINSGSMRYPLQEAHEYDEKAKLWTLPPKGSEERARLESAMGSGGGVHAEAGRSSGSPGAPGPALWQKRGIPPFRQAGFARAGSARLPEAGAGKVENGTAPEAGGCLP